MKIAVLGAGSWGIALSRLLSNKGYQISMWEFDPQAYRKLIKFREEKNKLPGIKIPKKVNITTDIYEAINGTSIILFAVPSNTVRGIVRLIKNFSLKDRIIVNVAKGIETRTLLTLSSVIKQEHKDISDSNYVALCGPSHAEEVSMEMPTTIVATSKNLKVAQAIQRFFSCEYFRVYTNTDLIGVEVASAIKNVIAIAAGISDGLGYGDNAKGALLTRGIVEMSRLIKAMGGKSETCFGLTGIGDLITTAISKHSRNRHVGEMICSGKSLKQILSEMSMVAEGVPTAKSAFALARKYRIEMPITEQVYYVLFRNKSPRLAVKELMLRGFKSEGIKK